MAFKCPKCGRTLDAKEASKLFVSTMMNNPGLSGIPCPSCSFLLTHEHRYDGDVSTNYSSKVSKRTNENQSENEVSPTISKWDKYRNDQGCFIATATYGDYNHPKVIGFRNFRDNKMNKSSIGRLFINLYYCISPSLSKIVEKSTTLKKTSRFILDKLSNSINS